MENGRCDKGSDTKAGSSRGGKAVRSSGGIWVRKVGAPVDAKKLGSGGREKGSAKGLGS